ncbi:hypothetical protein EZV62_022782 [Acer yangbiense]|uniref:SRP54-type proteins GTP-binding domain-containing protein n=1 Tax=Acer yangbiense TaxID=1000413 RepID=A0A5C7GZP2_9ROSI|nr:hypothetical protein EZV62_022782 [Acer yangbiense]
MALAELGEIMSRARKQMLNATIIDEKVFNELLDEISRALLQSDVPLELVSEIQTTMKETFNLIGDRNNKFRIIQLEIYDELCRILYPGNPSFTPEKGKASVIMFVGQRYVICMKNAGFEKTICTKYAYYHLKKGWKPALVYANTSRAGAFNQLEQNATDAKIPLYESYTELDPVRVAVEGVERFKKENCDLIIVDTSGCHKQDASLSKKCVKLLKQRYCSLLILLLFILSSVDIMLMLLLFLLSPLLMFQKPDLVIFVMDSSIGQAAAFDQAQAFKQSVSVGAVTLTKMDGHVKGVGALSAVAATKSRVIFIGTGVLIDEFRVFDVRRFVSRILGMGDRFRSMDKIHEVVPVDQQPDLQQNLFQRNFTLRTVCERFQKKLERSSIGKVFFFS